MGALRRAAALLLVGAWTLAPAQENARVVDIPTRSGVEQRFLFVRPAQPQAAVVLFAGGHGGLQIDAGGRPAWGRGNFLVRSAPLFAAAGLAVAIVDAPSDRQRPPYLGGFRQSPEHAEDMRAVIAWVKQEVRTPVWLIGTSRGTQSAAHVATQPEAAGADGLVLTSTILSDPRSRSVPDMAVDRLKIPVLVVHHAEDGCRYCLYADMPRLMNRLVAVPRRELLTFRGGVSHGDPCEARSHHGYNGLEQEVVNAIAAWISAK